MLTTPFHPPRRRTAASWIGALVLATTASAAQAQGLPNTTIQPGLQNATRQISPTLALPTTTIQPTLQSTTRQINPTLSLPTNSLQPALPRTMQSATGLARPTLAPTPTQQIAPAITPATVAATGLGRLVAPGSENASVVVARIGTTSPAATSSLTADFDGDGLINFEIAPGIVELGQGSDASGADGLSGLVGRHVSMGTGTAGRVLDSVINTQGIVPAATFEVSNGTVVLGGLKPTDTVGRIDVATRPDGPVTHVPDDGAGQDPGRTQGDDNAGKDDGGVEIDPTIPGCQVRRCDPDDPLPGPAGGPGLPGPFSFSGHMPPMPGTSDFDSEPGDLIDVSIMLPLRGREREGDQFSNYGNEEIW